MTEKLSKIADAKFNFNATKVGLLEKIEQNLVFTYNGGLFKSTPELMATVRSLLPISSQVGQGGDRAWRKDHKMVLLDWYQNPIEVDLWELHKKINETHQYALNSYMEEYSKLKKVRNGQQL